jgi:uncharacterized protein (TIGR03083 family)
MGDVSIDYLGTVWRSVSELCAGLGPDDWDKPTACPGWSVQDQLAHLIGPEALFLGRPQAGAVDVPPPYVRNDIGKLNEGAVAMRRGWGPEDVLAEFNEVTALRLAQLEAMSDEDLDEDSWTPAGPGTYRDLLAIRVLDCWVHEQDIREAVDRPGHDSGPVPAHVLGRFFLAMPMIVGKKAGAPDGAVVRFEITGPTTGQLDVAMDGKRAKPLEPTVAINDAAPEPTATVTASFLPYTRVCSGRREPTVAEKAGDISVAGDETLGEAVVRSLPFMM